MKDKKNESIEMSRSIISKARSIPIKDVGKANASKELNSNQEINMHFNLKVDNSSESAKEQ